MGPQTSYSLKRALTMLTRLSTLLSLTTTTFILLVPTRPAFAGNWGEDWGSMIWGAVAVVPSLEGIGLGLLVMFLVGATVWRLRRRSLLARLSLIALGLPCMMGVMVSYTFVNGEVADASEVNASFSELAASRGGGVSVPYVFTNGTIAEADQVNANFAAISDGGTANSLPTFPYVFANGTTANADEVNANFSTYPAYVACTVVHSFPSSALPKSGNANFQWKSWKTGCLHAAFQSFGDVSTCLARCSSPRGCCDTMEPMAQAIPLARAIVAVGEVAAPLRRASADRPATNLRTRKWLFRDAHAKGGFRYRVRPFIELPDSPFLPLIGLSVHGITLWTACDDTESGSSPDGDFLCSECGGPLNETPEYPSDSFENCSDWAAQYGCDSPELVNGVEGCWVEPHQACQVSGCDEPPSCP